MKKPTHEPICPYCKGIQYDHDSSVNLDIADYGSDLIHFCEYENTCGKIFFIKKVEADPLYKSYTKEERDSND